MTNTNQATQQQIITLEGVQVGFSNITKADNYGKFGMTIIGATPNAFEMFTTTKDGARPTVRCSGKPAPQNIVVPEGQEIEQGDKVNVAVLVSTYDERDSNGTVIGSTVYPRLLAVRLVEKAPNFNTAPKVDIEADFTNLV